MIADYYKILGVASTADLDAIKIAYRKKVMKCHPDRGGSHDQMVLVNTAWEVLSDTRTRRTYDEAFFDADNQIVQAAAAADAEKARSHAEQYPRDWTDFEKWLNLVAGDFTTGYDDHSELFVKGSFSGLIFVSIGAVLGIVLGVAAVLDFINNPGTFRDLFKLLFCIFLMVFLGAGLGRMAHAFTALVILCFKNSAEGKLARQFELVNLVLICVTAVPGAVSAFALLLITGVSLYSFNIASVMLILVDILFVLLLLKGLLGAFRMLLCTPLFWGIFRSAYYSEYSTLFFCIGMLVPILMLIYIRMFLFGKINKRHLTASDWIRE